MEGLQRRLGGIYTEGIGGDHKEIVLTHKYDHAEPADLGTSQVPIVFLDDLVLVAKKKQKCIDPIRYICSTRRLLLHRSNYLS